MEALTWIQDINNSYIASLIEVLRDIEILSGCIEDLKTVTLNKQDNNSTEFLTVARALETIRKLNDNRDVIYYLAIRLSLVIEDMKQEAEEVEEFDVKKEAYTIPQ